ncbi:MAG TPA: glycosyltransferase [Candidatus Aquilonibacter sp.]
MIVRDEEGFLPASLRSVAGVADEIVVVDTGSTDRSIEIARSFGASVYEHAWRDDFAWARNRSLEHAAHRWILVLDADEELAAESVAALEQIKQSEPCGRGFWVRIRSRTGGGDDAYGALTNALVRIFPNDSAIRFRGAIHEYAVGPDGEKAIEADLSPVELLHHGYTGTIIRERSKAQRNAALARACVEREPHDPFHWFNLGVSAYLLGEHAEARAALDRSLELLGDRTSGFLPVALVLLSEIARNAGDFARAEALARHSLERVPHDGGAHFQLGKALVEAQRYDEARAALLAAVEDAAHAHRQYVVDDDIARWKAFAEIGRSYALAGDDAEALVWYDRALAAEPQAGIVLANRARSRFRMRGDIGSALELAGALQRTKQIGEAMKLLDGLLTANPRETRLWMARAALMEADGNDGEQERSLRAAFEIDPQHTVLALSGFYLARGRLAEAAAVADDELSRGSRP